MIPTVMIDTLDVSVLNAKTIAVGRLKDVEEEPPGGVVGARTVTIAPTEALKGTSGGPFRLKGFFPPYWTNQWGKGHRLLVFRGERDEFDGRVVDLDGSDLALTTADMVVLRTPDEVLEAVRRILRKHPDGKPVETAVAGGYRLPVDARLERRARGDLGASDPYKRGEGLRLLQPFRSEANAALVRPLLTDPADKLMSKAEENWGIEVRRFPVRQAARELLVGWRMAAEGPPSQVEIPRYDTLTTLTPSEITEAGLVALPRFRRLREVKFYAPGPNAAQLARFAAVPTLETLDLTSTYLFDDDAAAALTGMPSLRILDARWTRLGDAGLRSLIPLKGLRRVDVDGSLVTPAGAAAFRKARPEVRLFPEVVPSPIAVLAAQGDVEGVRRELDLDPKVRDARDAGGNTPLHLLAGRGSVEGVRLLLARGAAVDAANKDGKTPLALANTNWTDLRVLRLLLGRGADVDHRDNEGRTVLKTAMEYGLFRQIPLFLAVGADPFARNKEGKTPLDDARAPRETQESFRRFVELAKAPVPLVKPTKALTPKVVYALKPGVLRGLTTASLGRLVGPLAWGKSPTGRAILGPFGGQATTLRLAGLPKHGNVGLELDLVVMGSWDGNGDGAGPDLIDVRVPGTGTILHATFFNNTEGERAGLRLQSYPDPYPRGFYRGGTGGTALGPREVRYRVRLTFAHTASTMEIVVSGLTVPQPSATTLTGDETWGIAGLTVRTDGTK